MAHFEDEFYRLKLSEKFELLNNEGDYIGTRQTEQHKIHLFALGGEYIEMWMLKDTEPASLIRIDFIGDNETLKMYSENFDPKKDLGL